MGKSRLYKIWLQKSPDLYKSPRLVMQKEPKPIILNEVGDIVEVCWKKYKFIDRRKMYKSITVLENTFTVGIYIDM